MGTWRMAITAVIATCLCATVLSGQTGTSLPAIPDGWVSLDFGSGSYKEFFAACEFSQEQQKTILTLMTAHNSLVNKYDQVRIPVVEKLNKARAANDKNLESKAQQELTEIGKKHWPKIHESESKMNAGILAAMTNKQKVRWRTYCILKGIKREYSPANLTDKQWDKVMDACEPLAREFSASPFLITAKLKAKMVDILTMQQKIKFWFAKQPYVDMAKVCNLTDEQIQRIVKIEDAHSRQLPDFLEKSETEIAQLKQAVDRATLGGDEDAAIKFQHQWLIQWDVLHTYQLPIPNYSQKEVQAILTEQQKTAWLEHVKQMPGIEEYKRMIGGGS